MVGMLWMDGPTDGWDVVVDAWLSWLGCCSGWMVPTDGWDVVDGWFPLMVGILWMDGSH